MHTAAIKKIEVLRANIFYVNFKNSNNIIKISVIEFEKHNNKQISCCI